MNEKVINILNHYTENIAVCTIDILSKMDKNTDKNTPEYRTLRRWFTDFITAYGNIMMSNSIVPLTLTLSYFFDHVFPMIANKDNQDNLELALTIKDDLGIMHREMERYIDQL